jgi:hypothetical protein
MHEVRDWMEAGPWKVFENTLAERLREELATAEKWGVKPTHVDDPGFGDVANEGAINWAVTENGDLLFAPRSVRGEAIAHTVLTQGGPVVAAGEAYIAVDRNERFCTEITNQSGHYLPDRESLEIGEKAFKVSGITFWVMTAGIVMQRVAVVVEMMAAMVMDITAVMMGIIAVVMGIMAVMMVIATEMRKRLLRQEKR